jgi:hypothetical protein
MLRLFLWLEWFTKLLLLPESNIFLDTSAVSGFVFYLFCVFFYWLSVLLSWGWDELKFFPFELKTVSFALLITFVSVFFISLFSVVLTSAVNSWSFFEILRTYSLYLVSIVGIELILIIKIYPRKSWREFLTLSLKEKVQKLDWIFENSVLHWESNFSKD